MTIKNMRDKMKTKNARKILAAAALIAVCAFTLWFGTIKNPIDFTMSKIGNNFSYRPIFILWGIMTGLLLVYSVSHMYERAGYYNKHSHNLLAVSYAFLVLTVLVPCMKETMEFLYYVHVAFSFLFPTVMLISLFRFIRYLYLVKYNVFKKAVKILSLCMAFPAGLLLTYGKLTGVAEISFFVCISIFLAAINVYLAKAHRLSAQTNSAD